MGRKKDVNKITDVHIQTIKQQHHRLTGKPVSGHTINRHIRAIGTMFNWLSNSKKIQGLPECRQINTPNTLPRYYSDNEFNEIMDGFCDFYKNIYNFHRDTGLRLSEPYKSELAGNYLIIPPSSTKNIIERYYYLTDNQVDVVTSMRHYIKEKLDSKKVKNLKNALQQISRGWSEKVKKIGLSDDKRKFHCLRHTFCVRHYFKCRDLYEVQILMGHSDIQQTQKYAKLWHNLIGKLEQEFTDLIPENNKSGTEKWDWSGREQKGYSYLSREMRM